MTASFTIGHGPGQAIVSCLNRCLNRSTSSSLYLPSTSWNPGAVTLANNWQLSLKEITLKRISSFVQYCLIHKYKDAIERPLVQGHVLAVQLSPDIGSVVSNCTELARASSQARKQNSFGEYWAFVRVKSKHDAILRMLVRSVMEAWICWWRRRGARLDQSDKIFITWQSGISILCVFGVTYRT